MEHKGQITRFDNHSDIIEASKVVFGEGVIPHRIVVRDLDDQYVVHMETLYVSVEFDAENNWEVIRFTHRSFENGDYYDPQWYSDAKREALKLEITQVVGRATALKKAQEKFKQRKGYLGV